MPTRRLPRLLRFASVLGLLGLAGAFSFAQAASESQLKAAYLVNFLKYIEWPERRPTMTLCLFGRDSLGPHLASYEGRPLAGRELRVRRVGSPDHLAECNALFVPETEEARFATVLRWVGNQPILTVGDTDSFLHAGGAIVLVSGEGRLQFDINTDAINRAGLKAHSQMLRLARKVTGIIR